MLEKLPHAIGQALKGVSPGLEKTIYFSPDFAVAPESISLRSAAFSEGGSIPARYTEDGEKISPPLAWRGVPSGAQGLLFVIEDADSPTPAPIVHAIVLDLPAADGELPEAALKSPGTTGKETHVMGKNTFFKSAYLPPDPPPGGGAHRYVFQVYALARATHLEESAGRGAVKDALKDNVLARGHLIGTYGRA